MADIYCPRHHVNHTLTGRDVEDLINGMAAALSDAATEPAEERQDADRYSYEVLYGWWCPVEDVRLYRDGEMYAEHLESAREARLIEARRNTERGKV